MAPTQIDFYVLDQQLLQARLDFICRLVGKLLSLHLRVTVLVEDNKAAENLDHLLWHQPPESFNPHSLESEVGASDHPAAVDPVIIRCASTAPAGGVCINLREHAPDNHAQVSRLVEIVCQDPKVLKSTREKYKFYRQLNYPLQSHSIQSQSL